MADKPITREEMYLAYLTGDYTGELPKPITRKEKYLYELCLKGMGGEVSPEEIKSAVNEYLEKNPVKPGATTEQAQQIEQNKTDIASLKTETSSLKEDISNKITKFYASNQGETHITDSDNGKIQDMMIYGKSSQDGTPTPENPVEIKSVVNPTVKVCGKNLLNPTLGTTTQNGVTCTANGDGTYTLNGTATERTEFIIDVFNIDISKKYKLIAFTKERSYINCFVQLNQSPWTIYGASTDSQVTITDSKNIRLVIAVIKGTTLSNEIIKPMIVDASLYPDTTYDDFEPYHEQTVTIPYTLNAIPVSSGGNVTIDGQQYVSDYVDVERGKLVKKIKEISKDPIVLVQPTNNPSKKRFILGNKFLKAADNSNKWSCKCSNLQTLGVGTSASYGCVESCGIDKNGNLYVYYEETSEFTTAEEFKAWWGKRDIQLMGILETPIEIDLTSEEIAAFKALVTYYPTTNISVNSEQLDGYTIFNYPISMENGWDYVKQQIGDTREYIYDMDARTQDTDLQAAEAYVNSEYAVALTELEV